MRVDFYRIEGDKAGASAKAALNKVLGMPKDKTRTLKNASVPYRAQELSQLKGVWRGDMERIRMDDVPVIAGLDGERKNIPLDKDQGIGEDTAFLYDEKTQVLAIQSHRIGMSASRWGFYFSSFATDDTPLIPIAVPQLDVIKDHINRLAHVKKVHVRIAGIVNAIEATDEGKNAIDAIKDLADTAPVLEFTMTTKERGQGLNLAAAKRTLKTLYSTARRAVLGTEKIEKIDIVATYDDDTSADGNLLRYFLREEVDVSVDGKARRMTFADRLAGVEGAWQRCKDDLNTRFNPRGKDGAPN
jgi:hypothetical protein